MIKKCSLLIILAVVCLNIESFAGGKDMHNELNNISKEGVWKDIVCDGYTIYLYTLPFYKNGAKLFEVQDSKFMRIGGRILSPDNNKIAFTLETYGSVDYTDRTSQNLYIMDSDGTNLRKLKLNSVEDIFLITFLGKDELLFSSSAPDNKARYLYRFDLTTETTDKIDALGESTVGKNNASASHIGDLLVYDVGNGFIVYDTNTKLSIKIQVEGNRPILSPDGRQILFRKGGMTGDYYIISVDGLNETLILSEKKIQALLRGSGSYRDLSFASWSPDNKFILLHESSDLQKNMAFVVNIDSKEIVEIK